MTKEWTNMKDLTRGLFPNDFEKEYNECIKCGSDLIMNGCVKCRIKNIFNKHKFGEQNA